MRRAVLTTAILALGAVLATVGVLAVFTDQASVAGNTATLGTVDITTSPTSAVLGLSAMAPGDMTTGVLVVNDGGSLDLRYAMTTSATNPDGKNLAGSLRLRIAKRIGPGCDFPYYNPDGTTTALSNDQPISEGLLTSVAIGNPAQGNQAGDRTLTAGSGEQLCMAVVLPTSAGNSVQAATTTATFTFDAEQTRNNP